MVGLRADALRRVNPVVKLLLLMVGIFHIALLVHPAVVFLHLLMAVSLVLAGRVKIRRGFLVGAATTLAGYTWVNYLLFVANLHLDPGEALYRVSLLSLRLVAIILYSAFFVGTTDPRALATSLTLQLGVPYVYSYMSFVTLRAAPLIFQDLSSMMVFRRVKGYVSPRQPHRYLLSLLMPLLYLSVRRSVTLAIAMESRGFGKYPSRTYMNPTSVSALDYAFAAAYLAALAASTLLALYLGGLAPVL